MCWLWVLAYVSTFNKVGRANSPVLVPFFPIVLQALWSISRWYSSEFPKTLSGFCRGCDSNTTADPKAAGTDACTCIQYRTIYLQTPKGNSKVDLVVKHGEVLLRRQQTMTPNFANLGCDPSAGSEIGNSFWIIIARRAVPIRCGLCRPSLLATNKLMFNGKDGEHGIECRKV